MSDAESSANEGRHRAKDLEELSWFAVPLKSFILWKNRRRSGSEGLGRGTDVISVI